MNKYDLICLSKTDVRSDLFFLDVNLVVVVQVMWRIIRM